MRRVAVIGGGASGLMAAIFAARNGAQVTVFEKKEQVGKKLLLTGNGRSNYSNLYLARRYYRGHHTDFADRVIRSFSAEDLMLFFESIGMLSLAEDHYLYPSTNRAETVVYVLHKECKKRGVHILLNCPVKDISKEQDFLVTTPDGTYHFDAVILSLGSEASVKDKLPFVGYSFLKKFRIHTYPVYPALTGLLGQNGWEEIWDGVRLPATVSYENADGHYEETGEVQFTKDGISGIPVFQLSHTVIEDLANNPSSVKVKINFLPAYDRKMLFDYLNGERNKNSLEAVKEYLFGWLPRKIVLALKKDLPVLDKTFAELDYEDIEVIVGKLTEFSYTVSGYRPFEAAQTVQGGCDTDEVKDTMEVKRIPGLYITGEMLDIDGLCGGYNLHFAFATGKIAGTYAAGEES